MTTWAEVRAFADQCVKIAYKAQGYPSGPEIVLSSLLEMGKLGFLVEGIYEKVRPLTSDTFYDINEAMVQLHQYEKMPNEIASIKPRTYEYLRLAKIVRVLKNELHVAPKGGVNRRIWDEVLRVEPL